MTCQDFEELSGAYALGALTAAEAKEAEEHLAHCSQCTQMARELRAVASLLPLTVPEVEPSVDLKARIFTKIQAETVPVKQPLSMQKMSRPLPRRSVRWGVGGLLAAAVVLFALLGGMIAWNIALQQQVASLAKQKIQIMSYTVQGTNAEPGATGDLRCYSDQHMCTLTMHGLPQLAGNQVYQAWLLHGKQPTSVGLLNMQDGVASINFQGSLSDYDVAAVSLEPGPLASKDAPQGQVIAVGKLQNPSHS